MKNQKNKSSKVAVFADVENCYIPNYSQNIIHFLKQYSQYPTLFAYYNWSNNGKSNIVQQKLQKDSWKCITTANQAENWLDQLLIQNCLRFCKYEIPEIEIVVLITCDHDYVNLIKELHTLGKKVIVIGHRGKISHKLEKLTNCYYLEDLKFVNLHSGKKDKQILV